MFTEPGGVTIPGKGERDAKDPRDRAHALLDTDLDERAHVPGTTLAGALREMVRLERDEDRAKELFGDLLDAGTAADTVDSRASLVWVLGSSRADDGGSEFRTSTKIDRVRAAADENTLRTEEVLPAGARFEVFLRWDDAPDGAVAEFAGLVAGWRPHLGRGVSRGRGACVTENVRHGTLRLDDPDDLLLWLTKSGPKLARAVAVEDAPVVAASGREPLLEVTVTIDGPVRVGNGGEAEEDDDGAKVIPLFRAGGKPVLPGSGLKGLLRSRAEFILRSVALMPRPCGDEDKPACGECWTCRVFGYGGGRDESAGSVGARSMIRVPDAEIRGSVAARRTHIAIDRFTGGVLDGALYTMEVLEAGEFGLRVDALPFSGDSPVPDAEIRAVLRLVLEDLNDGIIGLGGGVARGYGTVKVTGLEDVLPSVEQARATLRTMVASGGAHDAG